MNNTKIERENIEISAEETMTTASTGIMALLPLVATTSLGATSIDLNSKNYSNEIYNTSPQVNIKNRPSAKLQISQGIEITENSIDNLIQDSPQEINTNYTIIEELEILETFVNDILNNANQQPGNLKSLMYDNIDDLLI